MKKMFKDESLQRQFERDGYVAIPFLSKEEVAGLLNLYDELKNEHDTITPVHSTSDTNKPELIRMVDKAIREITGSRFDDVFFECKIFLTNFLIKEPGEDSAIFPHYDWTFVDESKYASVSAWCPLVDVDASNGYLSVLKGSHRFAKTLRASPDCPFAFDGVMDIIDQHMVAVPMKAGEALIYNHALVHSSTPNLSGKSRPICVLGVVPQEADLYLHYRHPGPGKRKIEKFLVDTEFFYDYIKHGRPRGAKSLGSVDFDFPRLSKDEFLRLVEQQSMAEKV